MEENVEDLRIKPRKSEGGLCDVRTLFGMLNLNLGLQFFKIAPKMVKNPNLGAAHGHVTYGHDRVDQNFLIPWHFSSAFAFPGSHGHVRYRYDHIRGVCKAHYTLKTDKVNLGRVEGHILTDFRVQQFEYIIFETCKWYQSLSALFIVKSVRRIATVQVQEIFDYKAYFGY
ncbi:hypothetical protein E3N88_43300 [Mikania micrantha]|uniref:Uncharacterized protein n=1 Tax=Mikania micrantha TaxID=192012 RepID=A0A5N6LF88_9ASTR|nr:hypothetical protein E3N88_43300 [Mikania micrantha]